MQKLVPLVLCLLALSCSQPSLDTVAVSAPSSPDRAITDPVKLYYAKTFVSGIDTRWSAYVKAYIEIANLDYTKEVALWYRTNANTNWQAAPAAFLTKCADKEVWGVDLRDLNAGPSGDFIMDFAVRYRVKGQEYWDNNGTANYQLKALASSYVYSDCVFGRSQLAVAGAVAYLYNQDPSMNALTGEVWVKKSAQPHRVVLRVSQDNWKSFKDIELKVYPDLRNLPDDVEYYKLYTQDISSSTTRIDFAVYVETNGQLAWDNNWGTGKNYTLLRPLTEVESTSIDW